MLRQLKQVIVSLHAIPDLNFKAQVIVSYSRNQLQQDGTPFITWSNELVSQQQLICTTLIQLRNVY